MSGKALWIDALELESRTRESVRVIESDVIYRSNPWGDPRGFPPLPVRIGVSWNEYVRDFTIYRRVEVIRAEATLMRELGRLYGKAIDDLGMSILRAGAGTVTQAMRASIAVQTAEAWSAVTGRSLETIEASLFRVLAHDQQAMLELKATWDSYRKSGTFAELPEFRVPNLAGFELAARATDPNWILADFTNDLSTATIARVRREALSAYLAGQSVPQLARTIRTTLGIASTQAQTIARTSLHTISSRHNEEVRRQNRDVAPREKYVATLDNRTCPVCGGYDGRTYAVGEGPSLPAHFSCRCVYTSITKSVRELLGMDSRSKLDPEDERLRRSLDGVVPASTTWAEWLADQEKRMPGFARGILGAARYDAWTAGELKLLDLSRGGKIRTLKSLGLESYARP